jgi:hypothetical protein
LIMANGKDHTVPAASARATFKLQSKSKATTVLREYADRPHLTAGVVGWKRSRTTPSTGPRTTWRPPSKRASRSPNRLRLSSHADSGAGREGDLDPCPDPARPVRDHRRGRPTEKVRATGDDIARRAYKPCSRTRRVAERRAWPVGERAHRPDRARVSTAARAGGDQAARMATPPPGAPPATPWAPRPRRRRRARRPPRAVHGGGWRGARWAPHARRGGERAQATRTRPGTRVRPLPWQARPDGVRRRYQSALADHDGLRIGTAPARA